MNTLNAMAAHDWWGHMSGVMILLMMAVFIGIWIWAWRPRHRARFSRLARLPMDDLYVAEVAEVAAPPPSISTSTPAATRSHAGRVS